MALVLSCNFCVYEWYTSISVFLYVVDFLWHPTLCFVLSEQMFDIILCCLLPGAVSFRGDCF